MENRREIEEIRADKENRASISREAPQPTEGEDGESRIVELTGTFYRYERVDGVWYRYEMTAA